MQRAVALLCCCDELQAACAVGSAARAGMAAGTGQRAMMMTGWAWGMREQWATWRWASGGDSTSSTSPWLQFSRSMTAPATMVAGT
jgi:hypothetical protein